MSWKSYHLFLPEDLNETADAFLSEGLHPTLRHQEENGLLRRFFFIRYSEGGLHIRLRYLPTDPQAAESLEKNIHQCASAYGARLEAHTYDRTVHYFGETAESVYAELLNIATSKLSLTLLQSFGVEQRGHRWIALTCVVGFILRDSQERSDPLLAVEEGRSFALRAGRATGLGPSTAKGSAHPGWSAAVEAAWPQVHAGTPPELICPVVSLVRRTRRRGPAGRRVAIHALHLLFNKTGFSLAEEYEAFSTLSHINPFCKETS